MKYKYSLTESYTSQEVADGTRRYIQLAIEQGAQQLVLREAIQALALMGYSLNLVQDGTYVNDKNPDLIWEARRATLVSQDGTSSTAANHERLQHWCQSVVVVVDGCIIDVLRDRQLSFATCSPLSVTATLPVGVAA